MTKQGILLELEAIANDLDCVRGNPDAARIRSDAAMISGEIPGETIVAVSDLAQLEKELANKGAAAASVRLRAVVAHYIDSQGLVTVSGLMLLREDVDAQLAALGPAVRSALAKAEELYGILRWNKPKTVRCSEELYSRVYDGFMYEADECSLIDSLEAVNRFLTRCRPMKNPE